MFLLGSLSYTGHGSECDIFAYLAMFHYAGLSHCVLKLARKLPMQLGEAQIFCKFAFILKHDY